MFGKNLDDPDADIIRTKFNEVILYNTNFCKNITFFWEEINVKSFDDNKI